MFVSFNFIFYLFSSCKFVLLLNLFYLFRSNEKLHVKIIYSFAWQKKEKENRNKIKTNSIYRENE